MKDGLLTFRRGLISPRPLKLANAPQSAFTFPENPTNHMTVLSQLEQLQPGQDAGNLRVSDCVSELRSNSDGKRALGDVFFFFSCPTFRQPYANITVSCICAKYRVRQKK
jgi:hypothetical protein